jgi:hypothetical protein
MTRQQQELEQEMLLTDELKADLEAEEERAGELASELQGWKSQRIILAKIWWILSASL